MLCMGISLLRIWPEGTRESSLLTPGVSVMALVRSLGCLLVQCGLVAAAGPAIQTKFGPVQCENVGNYTVQCLGIPYAAAPLAANRWRRPQPAKPWKVARTPTYTVLIHPRNAPMRMEMLLNSTIIVCVPVLQFLVLLTQNVYCREQCTTQRS